MIYCTKCKTNKPQAEFYRQESSRSWCKECRKADEKRRRRDPALRAKYRQRYETDAEMRAAVILNRVKKRAKAQGVPFDLTPAWVTEELRRGTCAMSGIRFDLRVDHPYGPSVDRKVPRVKGGGYTVANCRMVLNMVNMALKEWGEDAFYELAFAVAIKRFRS